MSALSIFKTFVRILETLIQTELNTGEKLERTEQFELKEFLKRSHIHTIYRHTTTNRFEKCQLLNLNQNPLIIKFLEKINFL